MFPPPVGHRSPVMATVTLDDFSSENVRVVVWVSRKQPDGSGLNPVITVVVVAVRNGLPRLVEADPHRSTASGSTGKAQPRNAKSSVTVALKTRPPGAAETPGAAAVIPPSRTSRVPAETLVLVRVLIALPSRVGLGCRSCSLGPRLETRRIPRIVR